MSKATFFPWLARSILWVVAAFYVYGAAVHVANMLSVTGFDWLAAPSKWQVLDVVYLVLDCIVAVGHWRRFPISIFALYLAGTSQVALYTVGRSWVLDVPESFAPSVDQVAYLDTLVGFHLSTLAAVTMALLILRR